MKMMLGLWCDLKTFLSTFRPFGSIPTSGHDWVAEEQDVPAYVDVLRCRRCGDVEICWVRKETKDSGKGRYE